MKYLPHLSWVDRGLRYTDEDALNTHQKSPLHHSIVDLFSTQPPLLDGTPVLMQAATLHSLTRPEISKANDPYIVFGTVDFVEGGLDESLPYWKDVFETTKEDEEGTLSYSLCRDVKDPKKLRTVEAFSSKEYLWDMHAKSKAVADNVKHTKHLRTGLKHVFLQMVGGYFYK